LNILQELINEALLPRSPDIDDRFFTSSAASAFLNFKVHFCRLRGMKRVVFGLLASVAAIQFSFAQNGTYDFLRTDVSARAAALNGSFVSMTDDPNVLFYNPASIGTIGSTKVSVSYLKHLLDVNSGTLSYARPIGQAITLGAGITYIDYGSFNETDASLNVLGTFGAREMALVAGIATHYGERVLVGANAKFIYSSIAEYSSTALALDAGILYEVPEQGITIGGSILTIGTQLKTYAGVNEPLPLDIKIGITKRPEHLPVLLNLNFHRLNQTVDKFFDRFASFSFGAEFLMSESFRLRAGYNNDQHKDMKLGTSAGLAGFSMGGGLSLKDYQIDYAFNSYGKIGGLHRISLGINL
jgi:hypothetical protein